MIQIIGFALASCYAPVYELVFLIQIGSILLPVRVVSLAVDAQQIVLTQPNLAVRHPFGAAAPSPPWTQGTAIVFSTLRLAMSRDEEAGGGGAAAPDPRRATELITNPLDPFKSTTPVDRHCARADRVSGLCKADID